MKKSIEWIEKGKITYLQTITHGYKNQLKTFIDIVQGNIMGKAIVEIQIVI